MSKLGTLLGIALVVSFWNGFCQDNGEWSRVACPPATPSSYCLLAEKTGAWPVINSSWTVLALACPWMIELRDPLTGQSRGEIAPPPMRRFTGLPAFSRDGRLLAAYVDDGTLRVWELTSGQEVWAFPTSQSGHLACFDFEGELLAGSGPDAAIAVWDLAVGSLISSLQESEGMAPLEFSPDGRWLVGLRPGSNDHPEPTYGVWEVPSGRQAGFFSGPVKFLPSGQFLKVETRGGQLVISVWDGPEGEKLQEATLPYRPEDTNLLAVSPEGEVIAFGSAEGQIWFWQVAGAREVARLDLRAALEVGEGAHFRVAELAFAPDGELFITMIWRSQDRVQIYLWNIGGLLAGK
jgi:WD40 repeat protein